MRRALIVSGVLLLAYAMIGAAVDDELDRLGVLVFLVAVVVVHDAVVVPLVLAVGALIRRTVPVAWQGTVRIAAVVTLAVSVVAVPLALGAGGACADSAPAVPYARNLMVIFVVIGVTAVVGRKGIESRRVRHRGRGVGNLPP